MEAAVQGVIPAHRPGERSGRRACSSASPAPRGVLSCQEDEDRAE